MRMAGTRTHTRALRPIPLPCCCRQTSGCGSPIIMVHGFGLSSSHYRKTIKQLSSQGYKVGPHTT